jgi:hypothetical protein
MFHRDRLREGSTKLAERVEALKLGDSKDRLPDLRNPLKVIVLNLNLECLGGHVPMLARPKLLVKGNMLQRSDMRLRET